MSYKWKWTKEGRMAQVRFVTGEDIARLAELDQKCWAALSMPTSGVRFDARMLELMDADGDGRIRTPEVIAAVDFLKAKNVNLDDLAQSTCRGFAACAVGGVRHALPPDDGGVYARAVSVRRS